VVGVNETAASLRKLATDLDGRIGTLADDLHHVAGDTRSGLAQMQTTLREVGGFIEPTSPVSVRMVRTLEELSAAARAIRILAEYLERNPSALLRGREDGG
jgi:paraquat-inducible protein B